MYLGITPPYTPANSATRPAIAVMFVGIALVAGFIAPPTATIPQAALQRPRIRRGHPCSAPGDGRYGEDPGWRLWLGTSRGNLTPFRARGSDDLREPDTKR